MLIFVLIKFLKWTRWEGLGISKTSSAIKAMVVDFLSIIQRQPVQNMTVLAWLKIQNSCEFNHLNIVSVSFIEDSIKESERRSRVDFEPLEVINMTLI